VLEALKKIVKNPDELVSDTAVVGFIYHKISQWQWRMQDGNQGAKTMEMLICMKI
jgi:predicted RNA-binding protein with PUA domain